MADKHVVTASVRSETANWAVPATASNIRDTVDGAGVVASIKMTSLFSHDLS